MVSLAAILLALALLCWPAAGSARRLRTILATAAPRPRRHLPVRPTTSAVTLTAAVAGWAFGGPGGAVACALAAATAWRRWSAHRSRRHTLVAVDGLAEALRSLVAELRAGAHPAAATESAAADAEPQAARAMRAIAAATRLDGNVDQALATSGAGSPATSAVLGQLSRAWALVQRHGLPLADVLDAVRTDLETRARFARQVLARMAGPRASATILALLPLVGIALGEAMSAHPLHVLTRTAPGQLLLVAGAALTCAGIAWSARLTDRVVLP